MLTKGLDHKFSIGPKEGLWRPNPGSVGEDIKKNSQFEYQKELNVMRIKDEILKDFWQKYILSCDVKGPLKRIGFTIFKTLSAQNL